MDVVPITKYSSELHKTMNALLPQLSRLAQPLSKKQLVGIIQSPTTHLLMAVEDGVYCGCLSIVVFKIPTGTKAWIEDVVVNKNYRGQGIGNRLLNKAIVLAKELGATSVDLTSNPSRKAANEMYKKAGFTPRDTNIYRYLIKQDSG